MASEQPRDICKVIEAMLVHVEPNDAELAEDLRRVKVSAGYRAPEIQGISWRELCHVFNDRMVEHSRENWFYRAGCILAGREP